jgi:hypothetical protein
MATTIESVNEQIVNVVSFKNVNILNILGWILFAVIIIGGCVYGYIVWRQRKVFDKRIRVKSIVNGVFVDSFQDIAKSVKIGKGGFELIYLKKLKTWKLAQGARVGINTYEFYIMPDGYWYPAHASADLQWMDKHGGLVPVVTTNPLMRSQYTSLEKQIDFLHQNKQGFWDKYGSWVLSIGFVLISGFMLYLCYKEFAQAMSSLGAFSDKMNTLIDKVNIMTGNIQTGGKDSGLVPV